MPGCRCTLKSFLLCCFSLSLLASALAATPARADHSLPDSVPPFERPLRVSPDIPLGTVDPPVATAGQTGTWRLEFELAKAVTPQQSLDLLVSGGRHNRGPFTPLQVEDPTQAGYMTASLADGTPLRIAAVEGRGQVFRIHRPERILPAGTRIIVTLGASSGASAGTTPPEIRMLNKYFALYCPGKKLPGEEFDTRIRRTMVGACVMHILGGSLDHLRAYVPSQCRPGEPIEMLVRPEDAFSNLSQYPIEEVDVFLGDRKLSATVAPVANSTCIRVRVTIPGEGIHQLKVVDRASGVTCRTNPIACKTDSGPYQLYWGMIHGHTEMSDGTGTIDYYFRQMRDEAALDFAASSDHDHGWETTDSHWATICRTVKRDNEPGRFVTFLGYEWAKWRRNGDGDRNVYYFEDDQPIFRSDDGVYPRPPDLFRALEGRQALIIPHHPGNDGNFCDYKDHDPVRERLVEIHQVRGCYECSETMGNPLIAEPDRPNGKLYEPGFVSNALALGWRVGFTAGGDDHMGTAGTDRPVRIQDGVPIYAGSMAVQATARTRAAIWDALWNRRVIATSGPRVLLHVDLDGHPIGAELKAADEPDLRKTRRIHVAFHGMEPVRRIDIIRNNKVVYTTHENDFVWIDDTPLADALLPAAKFCDHPFCFYYVRVVQIDGQAAWASPIWIDP